MNKIIWNLFYLLVGYIVIASVLFVFGIDLTEIEFFKLLLLGLPVILLILHSIYVLGAKRALLFVLISMLTGYIAETIGLQYGEFFGGEYIYSKDSITLGLVPVDVIFYWAVFIYTSYSMVNGFIEWGKLKLNNYKRILLAIIADGLVLTSIDLYMDPIQVREGAWTWVSGGPYFNIPIGNFIGWFIVGVITTGIFRLLLSNKAQKYPDRLLLIPTIGYGFLILSFTMQAIDYKMLKVMLAGLLIMGSIFLSVLYQYMHRNSTRSIKGSNHI